MEPEAPRRGPGRPRDAALTQRRRQEILEHAARTFSEHGFRGTDVQALADELGIGKGTIYRYFPSKRELFLAAVDHGMNQLGDHVDAEAAGEDDPMQQLIQAVRAYLAFFDSRPQFIELLIQERAEFRDRKVPTYFAHRDVRIGKWVSLMRGLMEDGRVRRMPPERITDVVSDLLYGTIFTNHFAGRRKSFEEQAEEILDIVFNGILEPTAGKSRGGRKS